RFRGRPRCVIGRWRRLIYWRRLDRDDRELRWAVLSIQRNGIAGFMAEERLTDGSLVRDDVPIGIAVPRAEDRVGFLRVCLVIAQSDDCADGHARCVRIFK